MARKRAHGEGSISQRGDGSWAASLQVGGVRRHVTAKTRAEAARKLADLKRQAQGGTLPDPGRRTVGDLLEAWVEAARGDWKPRRLADVITYRDKYIIPPLGRVRLAKLTPHLVQRFVNDLKVQAPPSTALSVFRALSRACVVGMRWGWLPENPCAKVFPPKYKPRRKAVWSGVELATFLEGARPHPQYPLWLFLIASGCRLGEAVALRWGDVDLEEGVVRIERAAQKIGGRWVETTPKTDAGTRNRTLPTETLSALRRQRARVAELRLEAGTEWVGRDLVFPNPQGGYLSFTTVEWALGVVCERLGLPRHTPHQLRHLSASLLLAAGLPVPTVSKRLGHADSHITLKTYAHVVGDGEDRAAKAMGRALAGG